jgi:hypothetical protein
LYGTDRAIAKIVPLGNRRSGHGSGVNIVYAPITLANYLLKVGRAA